MKEMKNFFSPEFINRIDDTIVFNSLSQDDIKKITDIELKKLMKRLEEMKYKISYDESLVEYLSKIGYDEVYGARPLKRAIQDKVEDLLSEEVLTDKIIEGKTYPKIFRSGYRMKCHSHFICIHIYSIVIACHV